MAPIQLSFFYSGDYLDDPSLRPKLTVVSRADTPVVPLHLRMPLPGGKSWLLTTEAGGGDCASAQPEPSHEDLNHYSLDFDDVSLADGVVRQETDVPVYAAAAGKVVATNWSRPIPGNGYYVVLEHDRPYDERIDTGFSTWYLHLKNPPPVSDGEKVIQGQQLGLVGNTGISTGSHLHFGLRFNDRGDSGVPESARVRLEGRPIADYRTLCAGGRRTSFYLSSNRP